MSDELPPPDLTKTADVPLDGLLPFGRESAGEVPAGPGETEEQATLGQAAPEAEQAETIFTQARPVRLVMAEQIIGEGAILEEEASHAGPPVLGESPAEPLGALRAMWVDSHDRGVPFYRRQGPLAGLGLLALLIVGAISFPWTRATIESGVVILTDESAETAGVGSGSANRADVVRNPTSATLVQGTKVTSSPGSAEGFQSTSSQIATTAGVSASASVAPPSQSAVNGPTTATNQARQTVETTTIAVIAPVQLSCEDPAAIPPACVTTTEAPTTTEAGETTTTEDETTTTTEPPPTETTVADQTTTTESDQATTEPDQTTTATSTPETTSTTEPEQTTTVPDTTVPDTTDPDTTDPDTTDPDTTTTTTTEPEPTTTTEPQPTTTTEPPTESEDTVHPAVGCTSTTQGDPEDKTSQLTLC